MKTWLKSLFIIFASVSIVGCGGGSSDTPPNSTEISKQPETSLQCAGVETAVASAPPLTRVSLSGLEGGNPETDWVSVEVAGSDPWPTALYGSESDGFELLVPLHPDGPKGGSLTLVVTDGSVQCPGIVFQVEALPPAVGNPALEIDAAMESVAAALADRYGTDATTLEATPLPELSPELVGLAMLFAALDAVDLEAELATLTPQEHENMQALLARIDLAPMLDALALELRALPPASVAATVSAPSGSSSTSHSEVATAIPLARVLDVAHETRAALRPLATPGECVSLGAVDRGRFGMESPEDLADYLAAARGAADTIGPLQDGISDLNSAFMVLGLVPGGGWTAAGISVAWGWLSFTVDLINQMRANLYPSSITRVNFQLTESRIPEDWDTDRDGPLKWSSAQLFATNNGMNITRAIIDGSLNTVSTAFAGAGAARGALSEAEGLGLGLAEIAGRESIDDRLDELETADAEVVECWNISATEFFPVSVPDTSADQWVRGLVQSGDAIAVSDREITPQRIGSATLRVETNTDNLPGPRGFLDRPIEVARKSVVWLPASLFVREAGNRETVRVRVDNSQHTNPADIEFTPDPDLFLPIEIQVSENIYEVMFTTPEDPTKYPLQYQARSISKELPPAEPARSATLTIFAKGSIAIAPRNGCVSSGRSRDLFATVSSIGDSPTVNWRVVTGQGQLIVGGGGLAASYVAPTSGSGQVTIRATLEQPPGATGEPPRDEVTLSYGNCAPVAVFYEFDGSYDLPGVRSGCAAPGEAGESFVVRNDNENNDGKNPVIPIGPVDFNGPGPVVSIVEALGSPGNRGNGSPEKCAAGTFPTDFRNQSSLRVTDAGDTVAYDINLSTNGTCGSFSDGTEACSSAEAFSGVWVRYALPVEQATTFTVDLNLVCSDNRLEEVPTTRIQLFFQRTNAQGQPIPNHSDPAEFVLPVQTLNCAAATSNITFVVDDPATPGSTDTMTVMIVTGTGAGTTVDPGEGQERVNASLRGTVQVRQADF